MPTVGERTRHLELWTTALGAHVPRATITAAEIRTVLHEWRSNGLGAATCNKRRTALMHLWSVLDGKGASNPVRDVPKFRPPDALPRGRDPHAIDAQLKRAPRCRSRACCRVMLWTGMRPVELHRAQPDDVNRKDKLVVVRTAKGGQARVVPLTPQALDAWKEFADAGCWEPDVTVGKRIIHRIPTAAPMNRLVKKWTGLSDLRVYDQRHTYGTGLARRKTRLDVIGALMGHSTLELTKRYTLAAVTPDAALAMINLARRPKKLAQKAGTRKRRKQNGLKSA